MKTINLQIAKTDGTKETVVAEKVTPYFAIYKRPDRYYVLTHIATGMMVASSRKKTTMKLLAAEPVFFDIPNFKNQGYMIVLGDTIRKFCDQHGWQ